MPDRLIRQYATFPIDWPSTADEKLNAMQRVIDLLRKEFGEESSPTVGYPTDSWKLCVPGVPSPRSDSAKPSPVAALTFKSTELLDKFREIVGKSEQAQRMRIGPSPGVGLADHWCPLGPDQDTFGTGIDALQQIDAGALKLAKLSGQGVNVVIVDRGLDKTGLPEQNFGGGWCHRPEGSDQWREPGTTTGEDSQHAMMIARNVLAVAPEARLYRSSGDPAACPQHSIVPGHHRSSVPAPARRYSLPHEPAQRLD